MKSVVVYIVLLLALCGASFWLGTRQVPIVESTETIVKIDTVFVDNPTPPSEVEPIDAKIVYLTKYETDTITITNVVRDSVLVYVPISDYTFEQDSLYKIKARGYDVSLVAVELYNRNTTTTTTLQRPIKHWAVNANVNSFTCQGITDFSVGVGLEYRKDQWAFSGGYQIQADGNSGVTFGIRRTLFEF